MAITVKKYSKGGGGSGIAWKQLENKIKIKGW